MIKNLAVSVTHYRKFARLDLAINSGRHWEQYRFTAAHHEAETLAQFFDGNDDAYSKLKIFAGTTQEHSILDLDYLRDLYGRLAKQEGKRSSWHFPRLAQRHIPKFRKPSEKNADSELVFFTISEQGVSLEPQEDAAASFVAPAGLTYGLVATLRQLKRRPVTLAVEGERLVIESGAFRSELYGFDFEVHNRGAMVA